MDEPTRVPQLDRLESLVNLVLEQTGRLFSDGSKNGTASVVAHSTKLKQLLPRATNGFHDALDELEAELALARVVMRRDLVLLQNEKPVQTTQDSKPADLDTQMYEAPEVVPIDEPTASPPKGEQSATQRVVSPGSPTKPVTDQKGAPQLIAPLQIDTTAIKAGGDENAEPEPNTGTYSTVDFDSLFNDPTSAGGSGSINNSPTKDSTQLEQTENTNPDTDAPNYSFESFNEQNLPSADDADNGDIASLLPGLESYANADNDTGAQDDFSMLDSGPANADTQPSTQQQISAVGTAVDNTNPQATAEPGRDTTFDDLMNFGDFDMSALEAGDGNFDDGDTKFDESFFDLE